MAGRGAEVDNHAGPGGPFWNDAAILQPGGKSKNGTPKGVKQAEARSETDGSKAVKGGRTIVMVGDSVAHIIGMPQSIGP